MCEGSQALFGGRGAGGRSWAIVAVLLLSVGAGCRTVAVSVEQPVGAKVDLATKGKWFGACGPDWGMSWNVVLQQTVVKGQPCELELQARDGWLDSLITLFPRQYRMYVDLSEMYGYPTTPTSVVEVRRLVEAVPPKYQDVVRLWYEGRTLDVLTRVPVDVLADVLYNLGWKFRDLLREVKPEAQVQAAKELKTMAEAPQAPSPREVESWLKSFLTKEQLDQLCRWVKEGVELRDARWVPLGGEPRDRSMPPMLRGAKEVLELFVRERQVRRTRVNFFDDVILRDLLVTKVESRLVEKEQLRFYADVKTFKTTYYSDRVVPVVDLIQNIGVSEVSSPTAEEEAELQRFGITRSVPLDQKARAETIRLGLPPVGLKAIRVTSVQSQVVGALLEGEVAYVVIWNNPAEVDAGRFLTTVVTVGPYGMATVWAVRGNKVLCHATAPFEASHAPPFARLTSWVCHVLDQQQLFVKLDEPVAVVAFGRRMLAPWSGLPPKPVSRENVVKELEPPEGVKK